MRSRRRSDRACAGRVLGPVAGGHGRSIRFALSAAVLAGWLALALTAPGQAAEGAITIDNQSAKTIKVVAPGGEAIVEAGGAPVTVSFTSDVEVGVEVKAWWLAEPRQLCQIFTPWGRTVIVTGTKAIRCRSR